MDKCEVERCEVLVTKAGHTLCYEHWKANENDDLFECESCGRLKEDDKPLCYKCYKAKASHAPEETQALSSTSIGEAFDLSPKRINLILTELGWIERGAVMGWVPTRHGERFGAREREAQNGAPYVVWPKSILSNYALNAAVKAVRGESWSPPVASAIPAVPQEPHAHDVGFREKFPATHRTTDGHMVRSRAEVIIDDWLYHAHIVHAYERKVPIDQELYCDFWIPSGKVYIEYWGLEGNPQYEERKRTKIALYKANGLNLIEVDDNSLKNVDDFLAKSLVKYKVQVP